MPSPLPMQTGHYYHVFNRGNNREDLFRQARNYEHFLRLYAFHVLPVVETYVYCLMRNHFHLLIRVTGEANKTSHEFANLFNAYTKAFNAAYQRTGSLFEHPFRRIEVTTDAYFTGLVTYIHRNPQKHRFVTDFRDWPYSSYQAMLSHKPTRVQRKAVLEWFGSVERLVEAHQLAAPEQELASLMDEDFD